jgi:hypothetical protein
VRTIDARQLLDAGIDPSENRRAAKAAQVQGAANSFEVVTLSRCNSKPLQFFAA